MRPFAWLPFTLLVGCSSPYQFSNEIGSFSTGVDNVASAYTAGYSSLFNDRLTYRTLIFNDTAAKLKLAISCSPAVPSSELPCEFYPQGAPQPSPSDPKLESDRRGILDILNVLTNYAHALQAVTNAADRAAFDSAASRLNASVTALLSKAPNPAVAPAFSAGFNIFAWALGQALDQQRFDILKQAVNLANGPLQWDDHKGLVCPERSVCPVRSVAKTLGGQLDAIWEARKLVLYDTVNALIKPLGPGYKNYAVRLGAANQTKAVLVQLEQAQPSQVTDALIKAHNALRDGVNDPARNFSDFASAVDQFTGLAEALKNDLATPAKAPSSNPGS